MRSLAWSLLALCLVSVGYAAPAVAPKSTPAPKPAAAAPKPVPIPPGKSAIIIFERQIVTGDNAGDVYLAAQKVSGDGKLLWKEGSGWVDLAAQRGCLQRAVSAIPDGQGGAIVVFESEPRAGKNAGDCDVVAQRLDAEGRLLWNGGDPIGVANSSADEARPFAVTDGNGGVIVAYERHDGDRVTLLAQRVSSSGAVAWSGPTTFPADASDSNQKRLSAVMSDGDGGLFAVYEVRYTSGEYSGDCDLHAQRLSGSGARLWTEDEIGVTVSSGEKTLERNVAMVADSDHGFTAVFEAEWRSGEYAGDWDIFGQRLDSSGKMLWNDGDRSKTVSSAKWIERAVAALPDGKGGLFAVFESEPREGEHAGDCDVYAQRLDADGAMLWNEGKKSSYVASGKWGEKRPALVSDGAGGAIIVFEQYAPQDNFAGDIDLGADRLTGEGKLLWSTTEKNEAADVAVRDDLLERNFSAASDGAGGVLVVYEAEARIGKFAGRSDLLAQRLGPDGKLLWPDGKPLTIAGSEESERRPVIVIP
jgi:hypothetical protein